MYSDRRKSHKNRPWQPELKQLVKTCRKAYRRWRDAGRPSSGPLTIERKRSKNALRSKKQQLTVQTTRNELNEIMEASEGDKLLSYQLIK